MASNAFMLTLYNVTSSDGYIMTKDHDESFIPDSLWPTVLEVFSQYKVILMGKSTYEAFQNYGDKLLTPFEELSIRKVVVSRDESFKPKVGYESVTDAKEILSKNDRVVVSSGPGFNNFLQGSKLIDIMILHKLPDVLGDGIKPFDDKYFKEFTLHSKTERDTVEELIYYRNKN